MSEVRESDWRQVLGSDCGRARHRSYRRFGLFSHGLRTPFSFRKLTGKKTKLGAEIFDKTLWLKIGHRALLFLDQISALAIGIDRVFGARRGACLSEAAFARYLPRRFRLAAGTETRLSFCELVCQFQSMSGHTFGCGLKPMGSHFGIGAPPILVEGGTRPMAVYLYCLIPPSKRVVWGFLQKLSYLTRLFGQFIISDRHSSGVTTDFHFVTAFFFPLAVSARLLLELFSGHAMNSCQVPCD